MLEVADKKVQSAVALSLRGLGKRYGSAAAPVIAVDDVDLEVARGQVLGLVGESGSGKSTIARLVGGLATRTAGDIVIDGRPIAVRPSGEQLRWLHKHVQMIFQDPFASLNPVHTVSYILSRPLLIHGLATRGEVRSKAAALLERVGLSPAAEYLDKRPHELSGGQRQRVGIARALAVEPSLILADEPTSMLDVSIRLDIMNLLLDIRDRAGISIVFITHDLAGAAYVSDRIAVMYQGSLVETGEVTALLREPMHPYTRLLKAAAPQPGRHSAQAAPDPVLADPSREAGGGCAFAPRCSLRRDECGRSKPPLTPLAAGRSVRCVLYPSSPQ